MSPKREIVHVDAVLHKLTVHYRIALVDVPKARAALALGFAPVIGSGRKHRPVTGKLRQKQPVRSQVNSLPILRLSG